MNASTLLRRRTALALVAGGVAAPALTLAASPAKFPGKPVTVIVPFSPGGGVDSTARLVADELSKRWGQPVVVMNRPGANGALGARAVADAAKDGYTLLITATGIVQNFAAKAPNRIDPFANFEPVSQLVTAGLAYVLSPKVPATNMAEFVTYLKSNAGPHSFASFGTGSSAHFAGEAFAAGLGVPLVHVPFQGESPAIPNIIGGQVTSGFISVGTALQLHRAGKVRMIAVVGRERSKIAPDAPTFLELGYKGLEAVGWVSMFAPKGTPQAIVDKISADAASVLSKPSVIARAISWGHEPLGSSSQEFARTLRSDFGIWQSLAQRFSVKLQ